MNDGEWHHAAIIYNPVAPTNEKMTLYLDGNVVDQSPVNNPPYPNSHGRYLTIGVHSSGQTLGSWFIVGDIDEAALYNRAVSGAEILAIYESGTGGVNNPPVLTTDYSTVEANEGDEAINNGSVSNPDGILSILALL